MDPVIVCKSGRSQPYWCRGQWESGSAGSPWHSGYRWFLSLHPCKGIGLLSGYTSSLLLQLDGNHMLWEKKNEWFTKPVPLQNKYQLSNDYSMSPGFPLLMTTHSIQGQFALKTWWEIIHVRAGCVFLPDNHRWRTGPCTSLKPQSNYTASHTLLHP